MKKEYDLSKMKSRKNPYASKLKKSVTMRLSEDVIVYFKEMAEEPPEDWKNPPRKVRPERPKAETGGPVTEITSSDASFEDLPILKSWPRDSGKENTRP